MIRDLIAIAGLQSELAPVFEFGVELAFSAEQNVAFDTPMICKVPRCVFNHSDPDIAKFLSAPIRHSRFALVLCCLDC